MNGPERGTIVGKAGERGQVFPLQTALNGRPGAIGVGGVRIGRRVDKGSSIYTPDGPKWTARSASGSGLGGGGGWVGGEDSPLQTALNGRPGA